MSKNNLDISSLKANSSNYHRIVLSGDGELWRASPCPGEDGQHKRSSVFFLQIFKIILLSVGIFVCFVIYYRPILQFYGSYLFLFIFFKPRLFQLFLCLLKTEVKKGQVGGEDLGEVKP